MGKVATSPLPSRGSPLLQSGGGTQKWPTSKQSRYVTPAVSGIPTASERGAKSEVPHLWAKWLLHPCRLGDPHRFRAGGGNQKWPTSGQSGYVTPAVSGILGTASAPSLEQTMGVLELTQVWQRVPRTTAGGGASLFWHPLGSGSPHDSKIPHKR